jgi:hypothetical protein
MQDITERNGCVSREASVLIFIIIIVIIIIVSIGDILKEV